ncbi:hypothetical protein B0H13DRAFT_2267699 [Mycena leptocephala]|nr:hypothetical protein B0H13DRAFT_2267699 [Mycena leptocephala]
MPVVPGAHRSSVIVGSENVHARSKTVAYLLGVVLPPLRPDKLKAEEGLGARQRGAANAARIFFAALTRHISGRVNVCRSKLSTRGKKVQNNMWPIFGPIFAQYLANRACLCQILGGLYLATIWPIFCQYMSYWPDIGRSVFASNSGVRLKRRSKPFGEWKVKPSTQMVPQWKKIARSSDRAGIDACIRDASLVKDWYTRPIVRLCSGTGFDSSTAAVEPILRQQNAILHRGVLLGLGLKSRVIRRPYQPQRREENRGTVHDLKERFSGLQLIENIGADESRRVGWAELRD